MYTCKTVEDIVVLIKKFFLISMLIYAPFCYQSPYSQLHKCLWQIVDKLCIHVGQKLYKHEKVNETFWVFSFINNILCTAELYITSKVVFCVFHV